MEMDIAITKMSSKGQIVIPEEFSEELNIKKGTHLVMIKEGSTIFLKLEADVKDEFADLLKISEKSLYDVWGGSGRKS